MKVNTLVPELSVYDINRSLDFYVNILSFEVDYQRPEDKFAMLRLNDSQIMIEEINGYWQTGELSYPFGRGINFQIIISDMNALYNRLKKHNYPIKIEPQENWYRADNKLLGQKEFLVMDPDGYLLRFVQTLGERNIEEVPIGD